MLEISEDLDQQLPAEYVERLHGAHRRLLADVGARALARRDPRRPRRRGPAADRRPSARCCGSSARWRRSRRWRAPRPASTSAPSRSSSASTSRARSTRASSSACSASRSRSPATSRSTRRRAGAAPRRSRRRSATCAPRCSARSAAPPRRPRTTLAEEVARLRHEYPELGIEVEGGAGRGAGGARAARPVGARGGDPQRRQALARDARRRAHRDRTTARSCSRSPTTASQDARRRAGRDGPAPGRLRGAPGRRPARVRRARARAAGRCGSSSRSRSHERRAATRRRPPARHAEAARPDRRRPRRRPLGLPHDARQPAVGRAHAERALRRRGLRARGALQARRRARRRLHRRGVRARHLPAAARALAHDERAPDQRRRARLAGRGEGGRRGRASSPRTGAPPTSPARCAWSGSA